jgi:hypothetical protein
VGLSAGVAAEERIYGTRQTALGATRITEAQTTDPWFGYNLGLWSEEDEAEAELAVKGEHYQTGEKRLQQRVRVKKI